MCAFLQDATKSIIYDVPFHIFIVFLFHCHFVWSGCILSFVWSKLNWNMYYNIYKKTMLGKTTTLYSSLAKQLAIYSLFSSPYLPTLHVFSNDLGSTILFSSWPSYPSNHTSPGQPQALLCIQYVWCTESTPLGIHDRAVVYCAQHIKWH